MSVATSTGGAIRLELGQRALPHALALVAVNGRGPNAVRSSCFTILSAPCLVRANTSVRVQAVFSRSA